MPDDADSPATSKPEPPSTPQPRRRGRPMLAVALALVVGLAVLAYGVRDMVDADVAAQPPIAFDLDEYIETGEVPAAAQATGLFGGRSVRVEDPMCVNNYVFLHRRGPADPSAAGARPIEVTHGVFPIISHKQFTTDKGALAAYLRNVASGGAVDTFAPVSSYRVWVKVPAERIPEDPRIPFPAIPRFEGDVKPGTHPFEGRIIGDGFALDAASQQTLLTEGVPLDGILVIDGTVEAVPDSDIAWAKIGIGGALQLVAIGMLLFRGRRAVPAPQD